jgi:hypothetical protein
MTGYGVDHDEETRQDKKEKLKKAMQGGAKEQLMLPLVDHGN